MILKAKERGNAPQLAKYLMSMKDNEHVELHDLRGFVGDDLDSAFEEAEALAKGTKCQKHLFSISLNPPQDRQVDRHVFEAAIDKIERKLDLTDHQRAIVFHEKEGRRHAHAVWSRIDSDAMRAKNMAFFKQKLMDVSRDIYLENGWDMPKGMLDRSMRNPLNYSHEEWQQAKRAKQDPKLIKAAIQDAWKNSDNAEALKAALEEKGFFLAKGDRRSAVAIDVRGETFSLSRWSGVKAKDVRERLGKDADLPSVDQTKAQIASRMTDKLKSYLNDVDAGYRRASPAVEMKRQELITRHQQQRDEAKKRIQLREQREMAERAARLPKGFSGIWSRLTGKLSQIKQDNEFEALRAWQRDRAEKDALVHRQLDERQRLQTAINKMREDRAREVSEIRKEIAAYIAMKRGDVPSLDAAHKAREIAEDKARTKTRDDGQRERIRRERTRDRGFDRGPEF
ncbi:relaxase/mobilization nuclease domain-containing protein [Seohaeicola saemankumensis]|uniref:relaxase/mobilization nuclease domain-containing protein n=1 Tax=Seohaeicola saemankumensis TaxID=481181 RepID=UPI001E3B794C|nr:relaxase/mobilization nuclease domain-containing protein [Seohaeicola saemankumensis]MCD1628086.1 relaxase/mobilization nuclease domain-containing protein [Seohaeicola saemankumensis]